VDQTTEATIRPLGQPGDLGWVVMTHGEQYHAEFGWDTTFEALVARIVADYAAGQTADETADLPPRREAAWIAELDGRRIGCVFCVQDVGDVEDVGGQNTPGVEDREDGEGEAAKLRILLVHPDGRGRGVGRRLVDTCVDFARSAGYSRLRLWTNDPLVAAQQIYLERGFRLRAEEPHHSFGVDLIGQTYELNLAVPEPNGGRATVGQIDEQREPVAKDGIRR
jgi:GNAT superfamily N-acetyltransferase